MQTATHVNGVSSHAQFPNFVLKLSKPMLFTDSKKRIEEKAKDNLYRCVDLVAHSSGCHKVCCIEGESCRRTKQVLAHYTRCARIVGGRECPICKQLVTLCHIHASRCQEFKMSCNVPHCPNKKQLFLKEDPSKANTGRRNNSEDDYVCVLEKFLTALRSPSADERRQNVRKLLSSNPKTARKLLREFYTFKRSYFSGGSRVESPARQLSRPIDNILNRNRKIITPDTPSQLAKSLGNISIEPSWNAKVKFIPLK